MSLTVRVLFDFDAQEGSGELCIRTGDTLTVTRQDVGEGWWEGVNSRGQQGLFPESYVEVISPVRGGPPSMAPPPLPSSFGGQETPANSAVQKSTSNGSMQQQTSRPPLQSEADDFDDDWSEDDSTGHPASVDSASTSDASKVGSSTSQRMSHSHSNHLNASSSNERGRSQSLHALVLQESPTDAGRVLRRLQRRASMAARVVSANERLGSGFARGRSYRQRRSTGDCLDDDLLPEAASAVNRAKRESSAEDCAPLGLPGRSHSRATSGSRTDVSTDHEDEVAPVARKEHAAGGATMSASSRGGTDSASKGTVRMKNINRFSNFVKSGMEGYILKPVKLTSPPAERHEIILSSEGPQWAAIAQPYTCLVDKPKKESKMKGLKSFIAYSLTSSLSGIQVSRRYKHFDWLHERLTEKYILTPVPPLPEKQVSGRYEEDLIEHRKQILQLWVNKLCRHPVLSRSDVWIHFLTCTDEKQWKLGKRKSEKDEYTGGNFFHSVTVPAQPLDTAEVERHLETFSRMTRSLDDSVRGLFDRASDTYKRHTGPYKASFQKMAAAFGALGQSFELDQSPHNQSITQAVKQTSSVYHMIGEMHEQQPKKDLEPLLDALFAYKGMLSTVPDIVHVHKSALSKLKDNEKLCAEGKIPQAEAEAVRMRVDTISYAMLAEINHFSKERVADFKATMVDYLREQVEFYQQVAAQLQGALIQFESV